jgi:NDP-sugar pyrophosphorylase family protein
MKVSDLFLEKSEPILNEWIRNFTSPADLFAAMPQLYANLESNNIQGIVEDGAVIVGPVHVGVRSTIYSQAIIRGPVIVGRDTIVSSHAEIQSGCFIGSKCVIGHGCSIINSMVMNTAVIWPGAFISNSVIGFGSVVGPGVVLGSQMPDLSNRASRTSSDLGVILGDYSAVGANSTLKAGTIVGRRTIIGEGVLAGGTYDSDQIIASSQKLEIKPRRD